LKEKKIDKTTRALNDNLIIVFVDALSR